MKPDKSPESLTTASSPRVEPRIIAVLPSRRKTRSFATLRNEPGIPPVNGVSDNANSVSTEPIAASKNSKKIGADLTNRDGQGVGRETGPLAWLLVATGALFLARLVAKAIKNAGFRLVGSRNSITVDKPSEVSSAKSDPILTDQGPTGWSKIDPGTSRVKEFLQAPKANLAEVAAARQRAWHLLIGPS